MPSLPSVPTSNMEREEEELELPGVPDHQPQVELGYWDQSLVDGLDNAGGEGEEEREGGIGGQLNNCYCRILVVTPAGTSVRYIIHNT